MAFSAPDSLEDQDPAEGDKDDVMARIAKARGEAAYKYENC